jgi:hypothetical protein
MGFLGEEKMQLFSAARSRFQAFVSMRASHSVMYSVIFVWARRHTSPGISMG